MCEGWEDLKGGKYDRLTNLGNLSRKCQRSFKLPRESTLKTVRAWAIKHLAMRTWIAFTAPGREAAYEWIAAEDPLLINKILTRPKETPLHIEPAQLPESRAPPVYVSGAGRQAGLFD